MLCFTVIIPYYHDHVNYPYHLPCHYATLPYVGQARPKVGDEQGSGSGRKGTIK